MHKQMMAMIPNDDKPILTEIFGYCSRGVPGLEIVGLGAKGKQIKEKFIYFNKKYNFKVPPNRYVLCVDEQFVNSSRENIHRWLELPFLIMYWSMAGILPIQNLNDCICGGSISATGDIRACPFPASINDELEAVFEAGSKLISSERVAAELGVPIIPIDEIIRLPKKAWSA